MILLINRLTAGSYNNYAKTRQSRLISEHKRARDCIARPLTSKSNAASQSHWRCWTPVFLCLQLELEPQILTVE